MRKIILLLLILFKLFPVDAQIIRFNKSYVPIGNDLSDIYNIVSTDSSFLCYGVSQYLYPQSLLSFSLNLQGNIQDAKIFGDTNIVNFCHDGESIIRNNYNPYLIVLSKDYNYNPYKWNTIFYRFNNIDTLSTKIIYSDTMICAPRNNMKLNNYYYTVGSKAYIVNDADHYDVTLFKTDSLGNLIWIKHYGGNSMDVGYKIINTYDNEIIISTNRCGYYTGNNPYYTNDCQWWIVKLDTAGNIIWSKDFGNPDVVDGIPRGLIETTDSNYIITGSYAIEMYGSAEMLRGRILKIDANGNVVWNKLYGSTTPYTYASIIKEKTNNDLICIFNDGPTPENGYAEIYNPFVLCLTSAGNIKWFRSYYFNQDPTVDASVLNSFDFTPDGGYIFAGYGMDYDSVPAQRSWVIKTDSLGFDGVTDFSTDTAYRIELTADTCYGDTAVVVAHLYGVTAPYRIAYASYAIHDSLYYSPMYEPYITDSIIITSSMLTTGDSILQIPVTVTDGLGRMLYDTLQVNVGCLLSSTVNATYSGDMLTVYPNPANDKIEVEYLLINSGQDCVIGLYDMKGTLLKSEKVNNTMGVIQFNTSDLANGTYVISVCGYGNKGYTKKINIIH